MRLKIMLTILVLTFSHAAVASLVNWDAFSSGDGLAVKDQSTGLVWLDLSQSAGLSYADAGKQFDGWSYASYNAVEALLIKALPNLIVDSSGRGFNQNYQYACSNTSFCYSDAQAWQGLFGSTIGLRFYQTHSFGLYQDQDAKLRMGGSYLNGSGSGNLYGTAFSVDYTSSYTSSSDPLFSTFLILDSTIPESASSVDEPALFLLFTLSIALIVRRTVSQ